MAPIIVFVEPWSRAGKIDLVVELSPLAIAVGARGVGFVLVEIGLK